MITWETNRGASDMIGRRRGIDETGRKYFIRQNLAAGIWMLSADGGTLPMRLSTHPTEDAAMMAAQVERFTP